MMKRPSAIAHHAVGIDLFSGCGGMSLGLEASGFDIAISVEFDAIHALIHHLNFPYIHTICQDINHLNTDYLKEILQDKRIDEVDLIAGGPPCFQNTPQGEVEKTSRFLKLSPTGLYNTLRGGTDRER